MNYNNVDMSIRQRVRKQLQEIEQQYDVKILYACESGSRGWGFASPDSDYDVRFLYIHQLEWYLQVDRQRDVIELPIDDVLDVSGWEWRKTLGLLKAGNPTLMEWLDSPIIYQQNDSALAELKAQVPYWFLPVRARWHYYSMARKNFRGYLQGEKVRLKKYFYVLRPLLAVQWIEAGKGIPPMRFAELLAQSDLEKSLHTEIEELLAIKQRSNEAEYGSRRTQIHSFIQAELERGKIPSALPESNKGSIKTLNKLLMDTVMKSYI